MGISVKNISKKYGDNQALDSISFEVEKGEIFGVIGADGAGKTTLIRILTSLILADSGEAIVSGCDVVKDYKELRRHIGYMPGRFSLYQDLSVEENLTFFATLFGTTIAKNYDLIKDIYSQIEPFKERRAEALSGGMKQKLALSCALIHAPKVLFLDEPTTGVDPVSRREFWEMLKRLKKRGITILVSTPYMDEAKLCDRIAFIKLGQILRIETPENIIQTFGESLYAIEADKMLPLLRDCRKNSDVKSCHPFGSEHHITVKPSFNKDKLVEFLTQKGHKNITISKIQPTIEDCYMKLAMESENE